RPESDPRPIARGSHLIGPDRFFVWNSPIQAAHVSLDFFDAANRSLYEEPEEAVRLWLEQSVILGERLYIKTHAHSLHPAYLAWEDDRPIPHTFRDIVVLFELLQRACDAAKVPLVAATVNEVMTRLRGLDQDECKENAAEALADTASQSFSPPPP